MHGAREFFDKAGTLTRAGSFDDGTHTGTGTTYDSTGTPHRVTLN